MNDTITRPLIPILQEVIPTIYDNTMTYYELLNKVVYILNETVKEVDKYTSQDITVYVDAALQKMIDDGTFDKIISDNLKATQVEDDLNAYIASNNDALAGLTASTNEAISSLKLYRLKGRNLVCFGDSWIAAHNVYANAVYPEIIAADYGMQLLNYAVSGATYSDYNPDKKVLHVITQLEKAIDEMSEEDKNKTSLVIVNCGANDMKHLSANTSTQFRNGVLNFYNKLKGVYPNARICVVLDHWYSGKDYHYLQYSQLLADALKGYKINALYLDSFFNEFCCQTSAYYNSDYMHPNTQGHLAIAALVKSRLMGANWNSKRVGFGVFNVYKTQHPTLKTSTTHFLMDHGMITLPSLTFTCDEDLTGDFGIMTLVEPENDIKANWNILPEGIASGEVTAPDSLKHLGTWYINRNGICRVDLGSNTARTFQLCAIHYPVAGKTAVNPD